MPIHIDNPYRLGHLNSKKMIRSQISKSGFYNYLAYYVVKMCCMIIFPLFGYKQMHGQTVEGAIKIAENNLNFAVAIDNDIKT